MAINPSTLRSKALSYLVRRKSRNETQDAGFLELNSYHSSSLYRVVAMGTLSCLPTCRPWEHCAVLLNHWNNLAMQDFSSFPFYR